MTRLAATNTRIIQRTSRPLAPGMWVSIVIVSPGGAEYDGDPTIDVGITVVETSVVKVDMVLVWR